MSFIPYNADPATTSAGYSLGDSIISYMAADKTLTNAYAGAPKGWATDNFGLQMMENYVNTAEWPETAYSDIADYAISSWAEMAGLEKSRPSHIKSDRTNQNFVKQDFPAAANMRHGLRQPPLSGNAGKRQGKRKDKERRNGQIL